MIVSDNDIVIKVEELLQRFRIGHPPVPVDQIVKKLGIILCPFPADDSISGAILKKDQHIVIAVNPAHHKNRQRFTIAHELGHHFFHKGLEEHVDQDFKVSWRRTDDSPQCINWQEVAANRFAAELLMPTKFLRADLDTLREVNKRIVVLLAMRYQVSLDAMKIRLTHLGIVRPY